MKKLIQIITAPLRRQVGRFLAWQDRRRERRIRMARALQKVRLLHVGGTLRRV